MKFYLSLTVLASGAAAQSNTHNGLKWMHLDATSLDDTDLCATADCDAARMMCCKEKSARMRGMLDTLAMTL